MRTPTRTPQAPSPQQRRHPLRSPARYALAHAVDWVASRPARAVAALRRASNRHGDRGAQAIEWAIFALLSLTVAGLVAAAIIAAVNNRLPGIQ